MVAHLDHRRSDPVPSCPLTPAILPVTDDARRSFSENAAFTLGALMRRFLALALAVTVLSAFTSGAGTGRPSARSPASKRNSARLRTCASPNQV